MGDFCFHPKYRYFEVWIYCNFFVAFVAPVVIMSVCYSCILWRVLHPRIPSSRNSRLPFKIYGRKKKDSSKIKQAHVNGSFTNANQRNNNRITVLVVIVNDFYLNITIFFTLCLFSSGLVGCDIHCMLVAVPCNAHSEGLQISNEC